ncbi:hypothetical protein [Bradyrhizobium tunisiense]
MNGVNPQAWLTDILVGSSILIH